MWISVLTQGGRSMKLASSRTYRLGHVVRAIVAVATASRPVNRVTALKRNVRYV
jgi:hypothetical protein